MDIYRGGGSRCQILFRIGWAIPMKLFTLDDDEHKLLYENSGVRINDFSRDFCLSFYNILNQNDRTGGLSSLKQCVKELSLKFPDDIWEDWLDVYLLWEAAMNMLISARAPWEMLEDLILKGINLIVSIACSMEKPEALQPLATKYEAYFDQLCQDNAQASPSGDDAESVNIIMKTIRCRMDLE
jgi:hypothetical protein